MSHLPMYNPLEQFEVYGGGGHLSDLLTPFWVTNIAIFLMLSLMIMMIMMILISRDLKVKPSLFNIVLETWITSILGMVKDQLGSKGLIYFPLIISLFSFILLQNVLGMIPYSFTATSHIIVTIGFSLSIMIGVTIIGFLRYRTDFFSLFVPSGTPIALVPLLTLIEFISYTARAFSLALRLSVNVTAGHSLFGVISMLSYSALIGASGIIMKTATIALPLLILVPLYGLELVVAVLQAYVFTLLTISYLRDVS